MAWARSCIRWLVRGTVFWLGPLVTVVVLLICIGFRQFEPTIRLTGLILQLMGVFTVGLGLEQTRRLFGVPSLPRSASDWLRSVPIPRKPRVVNLSAHSAGSTTMFGRLSLRQRAREGASVEERVRVLEQNSAALEGRVDELESQHDRAERDRQAAIGVERSERERQIGDLARKLEATEVGGLYTSLWGLLCVTAGLLLATFSHEISDYLSMIAA